MYGLIHNECVLKTRVCVCVCAQGVNGVEVCVGPHQCWSVRADCRQPRGTKRLVFLI